MEFFTTRPPVFWGTLFYIVAVFGICTLMLGLSHFLGGRSGARARNEPFESGVVSASPERLRLSAKFYLVAMFFVIFDVEALFMYAWAVSVREVGWAGFAEATIFIAVLFAGLVYLWKIGALEWSPNSRKKTAMAAARKAREAVAAQERFAAPTPQPPLP